MTRAPTRRAQSSTSLVISPAYAPISTTDLAPAASRIGITNSARFASEWPHRLGSSPRRFVSMDECPEEPGQSNTADPANSAGSTSAEEGHDLPHHVRVE